MLLTFNVEKQIIMRTDTEKVVTNSMNYLYARFTFSEEWTGEKTAVFTAQKKTYNALLDENNTCLVPWEALTGSIFTVSVFCGDLITANKVIIYTIPSGYEVGDESRIPTPEIYTQVIERLNEIEQEIDPEAIERTVDAYLAEKDFVTEADVETIVRQYVDEHVHGVPAGGTTGQVLVKSSNTDYDTEWADGGSEIGGNVEAINNNNVDVLLDEISYKPDTQAYIRLYIDDGRSDLSDVWTILQEYGVVVNLVIPTDRLENTANNGQKIKDLLHDMEDAGCEIQSHSINGNPLTSTTTKAEVLKMLKGSKEILLAEGYAVNGFCAPGGGTDSYNWESFGWADLVRKYYLYSDCTIFPYKINERRFMIETTTTTAQLEGFVRHSYNDTPAAKVCFHGLIGDMSEGQLRHLIEYAQENNVRFITDYEYYKNHVISLADTRLKKLEIGDNSEYNVFEHFLFENGYGDVNYNHSSFPYAFVYITGMNRRVVVFDSEVVVDATITNKTVFKKADGTSFKVQRYVFANGVWTKEVDRTTTDYDLVVKISPNATNFNIYDSAGTLILATQSYFDYKGSAETFIALDTLKTTLNNSNDFAAFKANILAL